MSRNRNGANNEKREKVIMLASSALVLTALTMTGVYMKNDNKKEQDTGYTLDLSAMESNVDRKAQEIAKEVQKETIKKAEEKTAKIIEDDLDYFPMEVDSNKVEIEKAPEKKVQKESVVEKIPEVKAEPIVEEYLPEAPVEPAPEPVVPAAPVFDYVATKGLHRPLEGEVLIPYSMDSSVYFATLDQYKYNPALMLVATEGMPVEACADGQVLDIFEDPENGLCMTVAAGGDFRLTYGQLQDLTVAVGSVMKAGDIIGTVAAPTKYYSSEGANLYLKLTCNGTPVDPETLFQ